MPIQNLREKEFDSLSVFTDSDTKGAIFKLDGDEA